MYGWPAWDAGNGFTAAQGLLNIVEWAMYVFYLWVVWANGKPGDEGKSIGWYLMGEKVVEDASLAVLVCWAGAIMTVSKTLLYCEYDRRVEEWR